MSPSPLPQHAPFVIHTATGAVTVFVVPSMRRPRAWLVVGELVIPDAGSREANRAKAWDALVEMGQQPLTVGASS